MKVYIAGPMRGKADFNRPAFDDAEALLRDLGHDVVNPCRLDEELGFFFETDADITPEHLKEIMSRDIAALYTCDRIAMLPGWEGSSGASLERQAAHYVGIPSIELTATRTSAHATESDSGSP
jgi:hypothetical protein